MSGVSAQFQNGAAESIIKSVVQSARTMMLHANLRWPEVADESLWPHALQYAVYLHNIMPFEESGVSPMEVWSRTRSNHYDLLHTHAWGCPTYVLNPKLREGGYVPKWEPRSRRGQFVGYSPLHASSVGMIRNLNTHHVSPNFMWSMMISLRLCIALKAILHHQRFGKDFTPSTDHEWIGILNHLTWL